MLRALSQFSPLAAATILLLSCSAAPMGGGIRPERTLRAGVGSGARSKKVASDDYGAKARIENHFATLLDSPANIQAEYIRAQFESLRGLEGRVRSNEFQWVQNPAPDYAASSLTVISDRGAIPILAWKAVLPRQYSSERAVRAIHGDKMIATDCYPHTALVADSANRSEEFLLRGRYRGFSWIAFFHSSKAEYDAALPFPSSGVTGVLDILVSSDSRRHLRNVIELRTDIHAIGGVQYENVIGVLPGTKSPKAVVVVVVPYGGRNPANIVLLLELAYRLHSKPFDSSVAFVANYAPSSVVAAGASLISDLRALGSDERMLVLGVDVLKAPEQPKSHLVALSRPHSAAKRQAQALERVVYGVADSLHSSGYRVTFHSNLSSGIESGFVFVDVPVVTLRVSPDPRADSNLIVPVATVVERGIAASQGGFEAFSLPGTCSIPPS